MRTFVLLLCAAASASCLHADIDNGTLKCSPDPSRPCPDGYFCAGNGTCWKNGSMAPAAKGQGQVCTLDGECASGHCVDLHCCDSACTGQCQACDVIGGVCTTISGPPRRGRPACPTVGVDACAAVCDGHDPNACTFPGSSQVCVPATCYGNELKVLTVCDGMGQCVPSSGNMILMPCPAPPNATATCNVDHCDFVCNPPYQRQGSTCVMPPSDMG